MKIVIFSVRCAARAICSVRRFDSKHISVSTASSVVNSRQEVSPDYEKQAKKLDSHVQGDNTAPF